MPTCFRSNSSNKLGDRFGRLIDQRHWTRSGREELFVRFDAKCRAERGDEIGRSDWAVDDFGTRILAFACLANDLTGLDATAGGSDRNCMVWKEDDHLPGTETLQLHQMYRAMAWLGEPLGKDDQVGATPFAPRCVKDQIEEGLFHRRRDLFSESTSIYLEGRSGETIGQYGHSKDHRPDRVQMVVGVVLNGQGRPLCCELWPGNITDVKTLLPIVDRLRKRCHS